ncbi:MAG: hypothetical protein PHR35_12405, partial [Kiritimatiellae bacterium]|nr:hypothetical protein [Kiritimatiellia bacterium]
MAETELTALLIETGALHGVRLSRGRDGPTPSATASWPLTAVPAAENMTEGQAADKPVGTSSGETEGAAPAAPPDALELALRAAQSAWHMTAGCALALPTNGLMLKVLSLPPADDASIGGMVRLQ